MPEFPTDFDPENHPSDRPSIRTRSRKNNNRLLFDLLGWVGGGVAAAVFAWYLISSGFLDPRQPDETDHRESSLIGDDVDSTESGRENKSIGRGKPDLSRDRDRPLASAVAPWDIQGRFEPLPDFLKSPADPMDQILKPCRTAIASRAYDQAAEKWTQVRQMVQARDPTVEMDANIDLLKKFWQTVETNLQTLQMDQRISFAGTTVTVSMIKRVRKTRVTSLVIDQVTLRTDAGQIKSFSVDQGTMDRDFAIAVAELSSPLGTEIKNLIRDVDFVHALESAKPVNLTGNINESDTATDPGPAKATETATGATTNTNKKLPIPDPQEIEGARKTLRELYVDQFHDASPAGQQRLAKTLLEHAQSKPPAEAYALIEESANMSRDIGDSLAVLEAWQQLADRFEIDFWGEISRQIDLSARRATTSVQMESNTAALCALVLLAEDQHRFDDASRLAAKAANAAKKLGDLILYRRAEELKRDYSAMQTLAKQAQKALDELKQNPTDSKANLTAGRYLCFAERNWEKGLNYLVACGNPSLSKTAELDLQLGAEPSRTDDLIQTGNRWFESAKKSKGFELRSMMQRAMEKYKLALVNAQGLARERIQLQIDEIIPQLDRFVQYLDDPIPKPTEGKVLLRWQFQVQGPVQYDGAVIEFRPNRLMFTQGPRRRVLTLKPDGNSLIAGSQDGKSTFRIRMTKNQLLELRHYDNASGRIVAIHFGRPAIAN